MLFGTDVSEYVGDVDVKQLVKSGNAAFASVKCCDAALHNGVWTPLLDKKHELFTQKFRAESVPTSSYCFGHPSMDMKMLLDFFFAHAYYDQLTPVLDMESLAAGNYVPDNAGDFTLRAIEYARKTYDTDLLIYSGTYYMKAMLAQVPSLKSNTFKKWIGEYHSDNSPNNPPNPGFEYVAWQFGGDVHLDGVTGLADRDVVFADDLSQLYVKDPQL